MRGYNQHKRVQGEGEMCINCAKMTTPECPKTGQDGQHHGDASSWCPQYQYPTCNDCGQAAKPKKLGRDTWHDPYAGIVGVGPVCYACNQLRKGRQHVVPLDAFGGGV